jgi:hypothetical protein
MDIYEPHSKKLIVGDVKGGLNILEYEELKWRIIS